MKLFAAAILLCPLIFSCKKNISSIIPAKEKYNITGSKIYNYNNPVQLIGADAFHVFSAGRSDMNKWDIDIAREFVGNVKQSPLSDNVLQDATGAYLHPLQTVWIATG